MSSRKIVVFSRFSILLTLTGASCSVAGSSARQPRATAPESAPIPRLCINTPQTMEWDAAPAGPLEEHEEAFDGERHGKASDLVGRYEALAVAANTVRVYGLDVDAHGEAFLVMVGPRPVEPPFIAVLQRVSDDSAQDLLFRSVSTHPEGVWESVQLSGRTIVNRGGTLPNAFRARLTTRMRGDQESVVEELWFVAGAVSEWVEAKSRVGRAQMARYRYRSSGDRNGVARGRSFRAARERNAAVRRGRAILDRDRPDAHVAAFSKRHPGAAIDGGSSEPGM